MIWKRLLRAPLILAGLASIISVALYIYSRFGVSEFGMIGTIRAILCLGLPLGLLTYVTFKYLPAWLLTEALVLTVAVFVAEIIVYVQCNLYEFFPPGEFGIGGAIYSLLFLALPLGLLAGAMFGYLSRKEYLPARVAATLIALALSIMAVSLVIGL